MSGGWKEGKAEMGESILSEVREIVVHAQAKMGEFGLSIFFTFWLVVHKSKRDF